ncbi:predicted secreted protein with PEP-CTERM sorting signal (plasmid) [Alteromonas sp. 76-1]|uniref:hypothetical protein n=1 Tax=Alteromonas sp. 76-1 TaxID=2358187 RepID=UPI000FD1826F|nr:hypothetical protein [Alteromonas sp. 76-1]VEM00402.1 predicted secreted protein with PEP-CTERM sorting signal [Alteromonas sp. 76-1]
MKIANLILIIGLVMSFSSKASLITFSNDSLSYLNGDIIELEVFVNNANPEIDVLEVVWGFDASLFDFDMLLITDSVFDNSYFDDAFAIGDELVFQLGLLANWDNVLGTSFKLGTFSFIALENGVSSPELVSIEMLAQNFDGDDISATSVPAPPTLAILCIAGLVLLRKRVL